MAGVEASLSWAGWWGQESLAQHWLSHMPELGPGLGSGRTWSQGRAQGQGHIPVSILCASQLFPKPHTHRHIRSLSLGNPRTSLGSSGPSPVPQCLLLRTAENQVGAAWTADVARGCGCPGFGVRAALQPPPFQCPQPTCLSRYWAANKVKSVQKLSSGLGTQSVGPGGRGPPSPWVEGPGGGAGRAGTYQAEGTP